MSGAALACSSRPVLALTKGEATTGRRGSAMHDHHERTVVERNPNRNLLIGLAVATSLLIVGFLIFSANPATPVGRRTSTLQARGSAQRRMTCRDRINVNLTAQAQSTLAVAPTSGKRQHRSRARRPPPVVIVAPTEPPRVEVVVQTATLPPTTPPTLTPTETPTLSPTLTRTPTETRSPTR